MNVLRLVKYSSECVSRAGWLRYRDQTLAQLGKQYEILRLTSGF